ncbi:hypothetical protein BUALT_Bualt11G0108100 [Buddleja alternifolia]|uniref:Uncharacterized protein n=1 Tax=Buddleja alternifolia TaxID=168488 RepID=A0AAV6X0I5_9LAMI|nr:hypothetical protein BUALT_Bualt11G0108100 [Buddleja alternifolia]
MRVAAPRRCYTSGGGGLSFARSSPISTAKLKVNPNKAVEILKSSCLGLSDSHMKVDSY